MRKKIGKALTWAELATDYKNVTQRSALILPMELVFDWAKNQSKIYYVDPKKKTIHKINIIKMKKKKHSWKPTIGIILQSKLNHKTCQRKNCGCTKYFDVLLDQTVYMDKYGHLLYRAPVCNGE